MKDTLRAEYRKLITIRSTYLIIGITLLFVIFLGFYAFGFRGENEANNPLRLFNTMLQLANSTGIITAIIGMLVFTHEYRYNTISYTLTSARRRLNVLLAKITVVGLLGLIFTSSVVVIGSIAMLVGYEVKGVDLVTQHVDLWDISWRVALSGIFAGLVGLLLAALIRNQVGALVVLIIGPGTIEGLLSLLLKTNSAYLPFTSLNQISLPTSQGAELLGGAKAMSPGKAALVFLVYLVVGWLIAAWLFKRRDAN